MKTWKRVVEGTGILLVFVLLAATPMPGLGQDRSGEEGVLVRINGDATLDADGREGLVLVIQGDAYVTGIAEVVVVVNGTATLMGAQVAELVVVEGHARLQEGTVITGDVQLVSAEVTRAEDVIVQGEMRYGTGSRFATGLLVFGLVFGLGTVIALMLSGLVAAAVAPHGVRTIGTILTDTFGQTLLATLIVWVGFPFVAAVAIATVIGIPIGLGILLFLLPALGFLGYLIAGIRLGDYLLGILRGSDEAWHPYRATLVGLAVLLLAGFIPVIGSVVTPVAASLGAGALALHAWNVMRWPSAQRMETNAA